MILGVRTPGTSMVSKIFPLFETTSIVDILAMK